MNMRTFVISDIHGDSKNFHKLLADVSFDANADKLYVNGDVLDRGKRSLKLLYEIKQMSEEHLGHVFLTMGNHELFCLQYIRRELSDFTWRAFGSTDTVEEVNRLIRQKQKILLSIYRACRYISRLTARRRAGMDSCS